jgi:hypothetical protein
MNNDVAVYLDLDNLVIGATEANLKFDVDLLLQHIKKLTGGRLVLRRAYGDWRQRGNMTRSLAAAGFELQSTVRLGSNSKNLADMQMVVDAMGTLVDGQNLGTYVLITGDRDFAPLVQALRRRGKQVIGAGVKHTTSQHLVELCDGFIYYDNIAAEANQQLDHQISDLIQRALDQLLQDKPRVPASLLKQRVQALSKGTFSNSHQGRRSFAKLLLDYPDIVQLEQEGTTLFVRRPGSGSAQVQPAQQTARRLTDDEVRTFLQKALEVLLQDTHQVRASLLKQQMQDLSLGAFDETHQGDKTFRKFLDRYPDLVSAEQEGSTLYIRRTGGSATTPSVSAEKSLSQEEAAKLLRQALDELLVDQTQVRASLLKQHMQELSNNTFDETHLGDESFGQFLEHFPNLVLIQRKGTTVMVHRPQNYVRPDELHLQYRSQLKKKGLRVVPSELRLLILKDVITLLGGTDDLPWRKMVDRLSEYYQRTGRVDISKSFVNDVLRVARRAAVIGIDDGSSLAKAPVSLLLSGDRRFQEAVIKCDATYLREIRSLKSPFNLEQASIALYEDVGHLRYLQVLLNRFSADE